MAVSLAYALLAALHVAALAAPELVSFNGFLISAASLIVYIGSQRSLAYEGEGGPTGADGSPGSGGEKKTMTSGDALRFPFIAAGGLIVLFLLFRFVDARYVNAVLRVYFVAIGIVTVGNMMKPLFVGLVDDSRVLIDVHLPLLGAVQLTACDAVAAAAGLPSLAVYAYSQHWVTNNLLATSYCVEAIQQMATGDYKVSALLLSLLFAYDVYMVFYTPMMVEVATKLQGPIKLLFPRGMVDPITAKPLFGLLGLGDIVLPGIVIAMLLRADALRAIMRGAVSLKARVIAGDFAQPIFLTTLLAYAVGLAVTVIVMVFFDTAQPALLYLVPATLISSFGTALVRGEIGFLFAYKDDAYAAALRTLEFQEEAAPSSSDTGGKEGAEPATTGSPAVATPGTVRRRPKGQSNA